MKFLFIDESKRHNGLDKSFFILVGIMVNKENLFLLEEELRDFKKRSNFNNLKSLRENLPEKKKLELTEEIALILKRHNSKVISAVLGKQSLKSKRKIEEGYYDAIRFIIERFFIHLQKENRYGFIIHDSIEGIKSFQKQVNNFILNEVQIIYNKERGRYKEKIYPCLFFSREEYCEILQVSDLIAVALNSALFKSLQTTECIEINENLPKFNPFLEKYWPLFVRDPQGNVRGWGIKLWN